MFHTTKSLIIIDLVLINLINYEIDNECCMMWEMEIWDTLTLISLAYDLLTMNLNNETLIFALK